MKKRNCKMVLRAMAYNIVGYRTDRNAYMEIFGAHI